MFPTPHIVEHSVPTVVGENALGQQITEMVTRQRAVIGWHTASTRDGSSPVLAGRITTEVMLLTDEPDWNDGDIVTLPGRGDFVVHGGVEDFTTGPFGFAPGYQLSLRKVVHESS